MLDRRLTNILATASACALLALPALAGASPAARVATSLSVTASAPPNGASTGAITARATVRGPARGASRRVRLELRVGRIGASRTVRMCPIAGRTLRAGRSVVVTCSWPGGAVGARYRVHLQVGKVRRSGVVRVPERSRRDDERAGDDADPTTPGPTNPSPPSPAACPAAKRVVTDQDVAQLENSGYPSGTAVFVPDAPDPWGGCFPGPLTTGVPATATLTPYTGPCHVDAPGTTISNKAISTCGRFVIAAAGVTIRNVRFTGASTIDVLSGSLDIADSEADFGADRDGQGLTGSNITAHRLDMWGGHRQVWCDNCTVEDSYFHDQDISEDPEAHASSMRTGAHSTYRHNSFGCDLPENEEGGGCSAAQTGYPDFGPVEHNAVERNLMWANATGYCAYGGWNPGKPYNDDPANATYIVFRDNVVRRGTSPNDIRDWQKPLTDKDRYTCGFWGPTTSYRPDRTGSVFTGNMWDDGLLWENDTTSLYYPFHE